MDEGMKTALTGKETVGMLDKPQKMRAQLNNKPVPTKVGKPKRQTTQQKQRGCAAEPRQRRQQGLYGEFDPGSG
jgi:hypothetical protein